uniref:Uncharacterized protein n=1 Tax=Arundo donax TaxID=35708 RepID=A0A0A9ANB5_ARUDO
MLEVTMMVSGCSSTRRTRASGQGVESWRSRAPHACQVRRIHREAQPESTRVPWRR